MLLSPRKDGSKSCKCLTLDLLWPALMQAAVELLAGAQQWGVGEEAAARRLLQALVQARRGAATIQRDMQDQSKLTACLQVLQVCQAHKPIHHSHKCFLMLCQ